MTNKKTKRIVGISVLAALAWIISIFSFPILPVAPFLKIDFSDLPVLLGMYVFGPISGIMIAFIRSLLSYIQSGGEAGFPIGDSAAFIATISLNLPIYWVIRNKTITLKDKLIAGTLGTLSLTIMLAFINWLYVAPAYMTVMGFDVGPMRNYLVASIVPFNLIKGPIVTSVFFLVFSRMKSWLDVRRLEMVGVPNKKSENNSSDYSVEKM